MYDGNNGIVNWQYFDNLVKTQENEKLHLATKIRRRHMNWYREKMRVKIAAQTLSRSTAVALEYLRTSQYGNEDFKDSEPTEKFCLIFNNLFDIMNSRTKYGKYFKQGLQKSNETEILSELVRIKDYILTLKGPDKKLVVLGKRRTGFLGCLISIESLISMYSEYVLPSDGPLDYMLTYKMSQDHLEVFFCAIRCRGGHNNNPSAVQFKAAYKRLLMHAAVKGTNGNCIELEQVPISILFSPSSAVIPEYIGKVSMNTEELEEAIKNMSALQTVSDDHTYHMTFNLLSRYVWKML